MRQKERKLRKKTDFRCIASAFVLAMLCGCGNPSAAGDGQADLSGGTDYITTSEAKNIVLENAGFSEEQIRFVRFHLNTDGDGASYEIEFISETEEYDYLLDAATGEILAMNCEAVNLPLAEAAQETVPESTQTQGASGNAQTQGVPGNAQTQGAPGNAQTQGLPGNAQTQSAQNGGSAPVKDEYIGREAAKQAALQHAGFDADSVNFTHVHLEFDDGRWQYDVEFHQGQEEYDYDIDAVTGEILSYDHDTDYKKTVSAAETQTAGGRITEAEAKRLALQHAGISESDAQSLTIELDYDDGRAEYEVEWHVGETEYTCDVDAYTGEILSFEAELD
ncbi:MAG: PepSY domain-containing protein [Muribaculum sp.]|nr:PepSY domain-containing protein [Muribaculum sp.]